MRVGLDRVALLGDLGAAARTKQNQKVALRKMQDAQLVRITQNLRNAATKRPLTPAEMQRLSRAQQIVVTRAERRTGVPKTTPVTPTPVTPTTPTTPVTPTSPTPWGTRSPDGTMFWDGVSWVPLAPNQQQNVQPSGGGGAVPDAGATSAGAGDIWSDSVFPTDDPSMLVPGGSGSSGLSPSAARDAARTATQDAGETTTMGTAAKVLIAAAAIYAAMQVFKRKGRMR